MDFLDMIDPDLVGATYFNVYRKGNLIFSIRAVKSHNKITVKHSKYDFKKDDLLIEKDTECQYAVKDIQIISKDPFNPDIILWIYIPSAISSSPSIKVENSHGVNIVIDSTQVEINNQIAQLPPQDQVIAKELFEILKDCLKSNSLPKKSFGEKFGDFISKYGPLIPAFGQLALQILTFAHG